MMLKDSNCGELTAQDVRRSVKLAGWVKKIRHMGGLVFLDMRDVSGVVQIVADPKIVPDISNEDVLLIRGKVRKRPADNVNPKMKTGEIEVDAEEIKIINKCKELPFQIEEDVKASEELRARYRYLDLRRKNQTDNIILRSRFMQAFRRSLNKRGFFEIETPLLARSTPEGARDYIIPSRKHPGKFYSLPQSPQLYKQLLMVAGFERYYQIPKCLRDEDVRANRQPEFTQVDIEMSFVEEEDIITMSEELLIEVFRDVLAIELQSPFPRFSFAEAMVRFGTDKPDLRIASEIEDLRAIFIQNDHPVFKKAKDKQFDIRGLRFNGNKISRSKIDRLAKEMKEKDITLLWRKRGSGTLPESLDIKLTADEIIIILVGEKVLEPLGEIRLLYGDKNEGFLPCWVTQFPLFELDEFGNYAPMHHIFSMPTADTLKFLESEPLKVLGHQYDLVINGYECGGGSIRNHNRNLQERLFNVIGMAGERLENAFGFLMTALEYGAPPHGGIAFGFDRIVAIAAGTDKIRNVIPFPKTTMAQGLMEGSPSEIDAAQLRDLKIRLEKDAD